MTTKRTLLKRWRDLLEVMKKVKPKDYDQSEFGDNLNGLDGLDFVDSANCGTPMCMAGHYAEDFPKRVDKKLIVEKGVFAWVREHFESEGFFEGCPYWASDYYGKKTEAVAAIKAKIYEIENEI